MYIYIFKILIFYINFFKTMYMNIDYKKINIRHEMYIKLTTKN